MARRRSYTAAEKLCIAISRGMKRSQTTGDAGSTGMAYYAVPAIVLLAVCVGGWFLVGLLSEYGERQERANVISRAVTAASTIDPGLVGSLKGSKADERTAAYLALRRQIAGIKRSNPDVRFVYLMKKRDGIVVFLSDSENEDSADYSAPGDPYPEASPALLMIFDNARPFVEGPIRDRWGTWISAHAPVLDLHSGRVTAVFGMDIEARRWLAVIRTYGIFGIVIAGLVGMISVVFIATYLIQRRSRERITRLNYELGRELEERSAISAALEESERKYRSLFDKMLNGFAYHRILTDDDGRPVDYVFLEVNDAFERLLGVRRDAIIGRRATELIPGLDRMDFDWIGFYGRVALHGEELRIEKPIRFGGRERWFSVSAYRPEPGYFSVVFEDVTEKKRLEDNLLSLSLTDELTGLYNRRGFFTLAEQEFRVLKRTGRKACLVYIDLDGLKAINDSQGHETGDTYIRAAAEVLRGCFRESDIIARVGGDEFVVFPINADCESTLIIDRLKNCIESFRVKKGLPALSMSTGIGHYNPQSPMTLEDLLKESDRAMYAEKERKRRK